MDKLLANFRLLDISGYLIPGSVLLLLLSPWIKSTKFVSDYWPGMTDLQKSAVFLLFAYVFGFVLSVQSEAWWNRFGGRARARYIGLSILLKLVNMPSIVVAKHSSLSGLHQRVVSRIQSWRSRYSSGMTGGKIRKYVKTCFSESWMKGSLSSSDGQVDLEEHELLDVWEAIIRRRGEHDEFDRQRAISRFEHGLGLVLLISGLCYFGDALFNMIICFKFEMIDLILGVVLGVSGWGCLSSCRADRFTRESILCSSVIAAVKVDK